MIPTLPFGRTGHTSTRTIFGAAAFARVDQPTADRSVALLLARGVNHIDTAASYGDSELRLGPWLAKHRDRFFLATKTGERTYAGARDQIRRSLDRLQVNQVDLIQLHNLVDEAEWETALGPDGALKAAIEAREAGLVRFIGVTGHGVTVARMHRRSLERFAFDSVLLPLNHPMLQNPQYAADFAALRAVCRERGVAMQTIKAITLAPWSERPHGAPTWYEPLREQPDIDLAVHWVFGHEGVFLNTAGDVSLLPRIIDAAERFTAAPDDEAMRELSEHRAMAPLFT
ncbi:MAG TPA: aldo/keto reductase [Dehalococcoidia bacterium]|nr:aldo/keto reductase [Dehalococcoidia bacterium]